MQIKLLKYYISKPDGFTIINTINDNTHLWSIMTPLFFRLSIDNSLIYNSIAINYLTYANI